MTVMKCTFVCGQVATSRDQQVSKLLDVLSRRPDRAFDRFINALVYTHQDDVALLLDGRNARQLIESRDQHVHITSQRSSQNDFYLCHNRSSNG